MHILNYGYALKNFLRTCTICNLPTHFTGDSHATRHQVRSGLCQQADDVMVIKVDGVTQRRVTEAVALMYTGAMFQQVAYSLYVTLTYGNVQRCTQVIVTAVKHTTLSRK